MYSGKWIFNDDRMLFKGFSWMLFNAVKLKALKKISGNSVQFQPKLNLFLEKFTTWKLSKILFSYFILTKIFRLLPNKKLHRQPKFLLFSFFFLVFHLLCSLIIIPNIISYSFCEVLNADKNKLEITAPTLMKNE